jgi:DNA polymerase-1
MEVLSVWQEALANYQPPRVEKQQEVFLPKNPAYYRQGITYVNDVAGAKSLIDLARQLKLSHIGIDTEYRFDRPEIVLSAKTTVSDIRSVVPLLLSVTLAEKAGRRGFNLYDFVIDLREPEPVRPLQQLFNLPVCFVGHYLKVEFFSLWKLGLREPRMVWDTFIHEKAISMGRYHKKYMVSKLSDEPAIQARAAELKQEKEKFAYSLVATCHRHGVPFAHESSKGRLQKSFLDHRQGQPFSQEQIEYSAEDSHAAACLYLLQVNAAAKHGLLNHLVNVEMPWVATNAAIQWEGLKVDQYRSGELVVKLETYKGGLEAKLALLGLSNCQSHKQLKEFFGRSGVLHHFEQDGKYSFGKDQIKRLKHLHPAIKSISELRRISDLLGDRIHNPGLIGVDGRIHPEHIQLGTDTGRQTTKWPNIQGMDQLLRPIIIPEPGYGIGEVDWSQKEIGVAAAVYEDDTLLEMFNTGDVYTAMAKHFFKDKLSDTDCLLSDVAFKQQHSDLRNIMKTCTLGILYGMTPPGLAPKLGVSVAEAARLQGSFLDMFPHLQQQLSVAPKHSAVRGYATTMNGLRRNRAQAGQPSRWELNWLSNHPIQGSAAVIFKAAGNRLHQLYKGYDAHIIVPLHDSFVFEAPLTNFATVADLTQRVMCEAIQEYFPALKPRAEVNIINPGCWNKDGKTDRLEQWLESLLKS